MFKLLFVMLLACLFTQALELSLVEDAFATLTTNTYHYGDPRTGCMMDEVAIKIQGVTGGVCTAHCKQTDGSCPQDKPAGAAAMPRCALENRATGDKYCALLCSAGMSCGQGASCKIVQGNLGICTWDDVAAVQLLRGVN